MAPLLLLTVLAGLLNSQALALEIPSMGRYALIGELFDATANNFTGSLIFKRALPSDGSLIKQSDNPHTDTTYTVYDSLKEKANFLKVSAELAIDIKTESVAVGIKGAAEFLREEKSSRKHVQGAFVHKTLTKKDTIQLTEEEVKPFVSTEILQTTNATHVVTGAYYGGDVYIKFLDTNEEGDDVTKIAGSLSITLKATQFTGEAEGELDITNSNITRTFTYSLEVFGDVTIPNIPGNALEVQKLIESVPTLLKDVNDGKGKPMRYVLTPLSEIRPAFKIDGAVDRMVHQLDEDKLNQIMVTLDEISDVRQRLNDLAKDFDVHEEIVPPADRQRLRNLTADFEYSALEFQSKVREALISVRTNGDQTLLTETYENYFMNEFSPTKVRGMLQTDFEVLHRKIPFYKNFRGRNFTYLGKSDSLGPFLIKTQGSIVYVLYFNITLLEANGAIWEQNRELLGYIDQEWSTIAVLDCDFWKVQCREHSHTVIQGYFKGSMGTFDARLDMPIRDESVKVLPALGRSNKIGDLYDATTGTFLDESLFLKKKLGDKVSESPSLASGLSRAVDFVGWGGLLDVLRAPAELGSLLYREGMVLEGSGEIFMPIHNRPDARASNVVWINRTKIETMSMEADQKLFDLLDMATITRSNATHFIQKVEYGATTFIRFENSTNPDQALQDANAWLKQIEETFLTWGSRKGDAAWVFNYTSNSQMQLFSDVSPRSLHKINDKDLKSFLKNSATYIHQYNERRGVPVFFTLRPITILKKNFAVASRSQYVVPQHEELKRKMVSQCGKVKVPLACINRRFNFFDLVQRKNVKFIHDEDTFVQAFDSTQESKAFILFFRYEWIASEAISWVKNSERFFNTITGLERFAMDCNSFDGKSGSLCDNVTSPAIYAFQNGQIASRDYVKEIVHIGPGNNDKDMITNKLKEELSKHNRKLGHLFQNMSQSLEDAESRIQATLESEREEMEARFGTIQNGRPPVGFLYLQYEGEESPEDLWEGTEWTDVTDSYPLQYGKLFKRTDQSSPMMK